MDRRSIERNQIVKLKETVEHPQFNIAGKEFCIEEYWDTLTGKSWMDSAGNPAAMIYSMRAPVNNLPFDNNVIYGKIGGLGHLIHVSEIDWEDKS